MESRKKGKIIRSGERNIVLNVYNYFKISISEETDSEIIKKTCEATGVSRRTVYRLKKESAKGQVITPRKNRKTGVTYKSSRRVKYDELVRSAIRRKVHLFFLRNIPPTIQSVLNDVNEDQTLPNFKTTTFFRLINDIGFRFEKRENKALLVERSDIIAMRHNYLRKIRNFRKEGRKIVYLDETWVNVGHTVSKAWRDTSIKTPKQAALEGLSTGLKAPTARGPRFVIVHAGGDHGFVPNAKLVFLAKKKSADYHDEMSSDRFEEWFKTQLIPNVEEGTVIAMDNASYHSRKQEKIPTSSSTKAEMHSWLTSKGIEYPDKSLKVELLQIINTVRQKYTRYEVDEVGKVNNVTVCRLPPYHCELNPIEMVWSQLKRHVATHNVDFKASKMQELINSAFESISSKDWENYCRHVQKVEDEMWRADELQDDIEPFIIRLTSSSGSSCSQADSEDNPDDPQPGPSHSHLGVIEGVQPLAVTSSDDD